MMHSNVLPPTGFPIRVYGLQELACKYFPDIQPRSAARHLTRIIQGDGELLEQLTSLGYRKGLRTLTPLMVSVLVDYVGLPMQFHPGDHG